MGVLDSPSEATESPVSDKKRPVYDRASFETTLLKCHTILGMMREMECINEDIKELNKRLNKLEK